MKTIYKIIMLGGGVITMMLSFAVTVYAADGNYTLLAPLPGITDTTNLGSYLPVAINLAIGISAALAFIMITIGGVTYATSDAIQGKSQGREFIENAIWGLLLVIGAWIILNTINPQILNFDLSLARPNIQPGVPTIIAGIPLTPEQVIASNAVRTILVNAITTKEPCTQGQTTNCVNLNGLPNNAISGLIGLKAVCRCNLFVSGGTEGGHLTHGPDKPIVDIRPEVGLNSYITGNANTPRSGTTVIKTLPDGTGVSFTYEVLGGNAGGTSTGDHWHVVFR